MIESGANRFEGIQHAPAGELPAARPARGREKVRDFISEDDLHTFDGWLNYQGFDPTLTPDQLETWRDMYDVVRQGSLATPKVGLMKLKPGEHLYAVAVREESGLWLTTWIRRAAKGDVILMIPRGDPKLDAHTTYHRDGTFHVKSYGHKFGAQKRQPLTPAFQGTENLGAYGGHGPKGVGAICDPAAFSGVVEVPPGVLGPRDGQVVVDLVEPGCEPLPWPNVLQQEIFQDIVPWVVIRIVS
jgi:hypothetical protein